MVSSASWYSFIFACMSLPIIFIMHANPMMAGITQIRPIFQLNPNTSTIRPIGEAVATVLAARRGAI